MTPQLHPELLERLDSINWFQRCGQKDNLTLLTPYSFADSWKEAQRLCRSNNWKKMQMLGQNSITGYLCDNYPQIYNELWNQIADEMREVVLTVMTPKVQAFAEKNALHPYFVHCVQWDIGHSIMEDAFRDADLPVNFFSELLVVYENGHFPCGWIKGDWQSGELVII